MEEGASQAKAETTKGNPVNITSTTGKTLQRCEEEQSYQATSTKQLRPVWILGQIWPLGGRMSEEEK